MNTLAFTLIALVTCEHFVDAIDYYGERLEAGDRQAQEIVALYEIACHQTMSNEVGDIASFSCVQEIDGTTICDFRLKEK